MERIRRIQRMHWGNHMGPPQLKPTRMHRSSTARSAIDSVKSSEKELFASKCDTPWTPHMQNAVSQCGVKSKCGVRGKSAIEKCRVKMWHQKQMWSQRSFRTCVFKTGPQAQKCYTKCRRALRHRALTRPLQNVIWHEMRPSWYIHTFSAQKDPLVLPPSSLVPLMQRPLHL